MADGWDLNAVVRSCATSTATAAATDNTMAAVDLPVTSISFDDGGSNHEQPSMFSNLISFSMSKPVDYEHHATKRTSKNNKRVVKLREEDLNNDGWAWRKYGQKPIKGSPYPRNYYRCSTTKDCLARRQVERSPTETSTFIVSYSGDHLHPRPTHLSSLAGTTRTTKFTAVATDLPDQPSFSPATSSKEDETEMNDKDID